MQMQVPHQLDQNLPLPHRSDAEHFGFRRGTLAFQQSSELENLGSHCEDFGLEVGALGYEGLASEGEAVEAGDSGERLVCE